MSAPRWRPEAGPGTGAARGGRPRGERGPGGPPRLPGDTVRAFLAIFPPAEVEAALAQYVASLRGELREVSWVKPGNLHLTLRFLGDMESALVGAAGAAADAAVRGRPAFDVSLKEVGLFPNAQRPRVVWLGVDVGREPLVELAGALEQELVGAGLGQADKPFAAHLTLGRVRDYLPPAALPRLFERRPCPGFAFRAAAVQLMRSQLDPGGSIYTVLHSAALA